MNVNNRLELLIDEFIAEHVFNGMDWEKVHIKLQERPFIMGQIPRSFWYKVSAMFGLDKSEVSHIINRWIKTNTPIKDFNFSLNVYDYE